MSLEQYISLLDVSVGIIESWSKIPIILNPPRLESYSTSVDVRAFNACFGVFPTDVVVGL